MSSESKSLISSFADFASYAMRFMAVTAGLASTGVRVYDEVQQVRVDYKEKKWTKLGCTAVILTTEVSSLALDLEDFRRFATGKEEQSRYWVEFQTGNMSTADAKRAAWRANKLEIDRWITPSLLELRMLSCLAHAVRLIEGKPEERTKTLYLHAARSFVETAHLYNIKYSDRNGRESSPHYNVDWSTHPRWLSQDQAAISIDRIRTVFDLAELYFCLEKAPFSITFRRNSGNE